MLIAITNKKVIAELQSARVNFNLSSDGNFTESAISTPIISCQKCKYYMNVSSKYDY